MFVLGLYPILILTKSSTSNQEIENRVLCTQLSKLGFIEKQLPLFEHQLIEKTF